MSSSTRKDLIIFYPGGQIFLNHITLDPVDVNVWFIIMYVFIYYVPMYGFIILCKSYYTDRPLAMQHRGEVP